MRYLIKFSYDGSNYCGYQRQKGLDTIQEQLENALFKINNSKYTPLTATGRTDKHVHALSQYAHTDIDVTITPYKLKRALNSNLPNDIHVIKVYSVKDDFHARYNVTSKTYKYLINTGEYSPIERNYVYQYNYVLNISKMQQAIKYLIGTHDYRAFVTENENKSNCVRTITMADITTDLLNPEKYIITFTGNGFMRYQVRNMVGLLLKVGQEKIDPIIVKQILDSKSRKKNGVTAPAEGLYLVNVEYNNLEESIIEE